MKKKSIKKYTSLGVVNKSVINKDKNNNIEKLVNFIFEYRTLKHMPRGCLPYLKGPIEENIAEHSFYTAIIGWLLAKIEKADENKVIKMCLIHDLAEVRGGEKNLINKFYTTPNDELAIIKEISKNYQLENFSLPKLFQEFNQEKSREAKLTKDADILAQMLLEKENLELGNKTASKWLMQSLMRLKTKIGQKLGKRLIEVEIDQWWLEIDKKYLSKTKFL